MSPRLAKTLPAFELNHSIQANNDKMAETNTALERVLNSLRAEFRGKEFMKIKIIKRAAVEKIMEEIPADRNSQPAETDVRKTTATVKLWINDLRQKHERERLSFPELFRKERCT